MPLEELLYNLNVIEDTFSQIKRSSNKRIPFEMAFVKLCSEALDTENDALLRRISALEAKLASGSFTAAPAPAREIKHETKEPKPQTAPVPAKPAEPKKAFEPENSRA